jgi:geranylgeranylglycerol-phosphate geranylgeranyltransferase
LKKIISAISITRPWNCVITFITVWGGAIIAGHYLYSPRFLAAALSAMMIAAYGNIVNDIFDFEVDKIGKPYRPLVSGAISRKTAIWLAIVCLLAGNILSHFVDRYAFVLVSGVSLILMLYTPALKGRLYLGNIAIALVGGAAFIYGGMAAANPLGAAIPAGFAFLIHLGREIVKDIEDREEDAAIGYRTGAVADINIARGAAIAILAILILVTILPYLFHIYNLRYLLIVVLGCDTLIAYSVFRLFISSEQNNMHRVSLYLKLAMPIGLLAVMVG